MKVNLSPSQINVSSLKAHNAHIIFNDIAQFEHPKNKNKNVFWRKENF